jgi:hypothetical protein
MWLRPGHLVPKILLLSVAALFVGALLIPHFWWLTLWTGLLLLGTLGYAKDIFDIGISRKINAALLFAFIIISVLQLIDSRHSETVKERKLYSDFAESLSRKESILFRFPAEPNGPPYIGAPAEIRFRPILASQGYDCFFVACSRVGHLRYDSHESRMLDLFEATLVNWLRSSRGMNWVAPHFNQGARFISTDPDQAVKSISALCAAFPHNRIFQYAAHTNDSFFTFDYREPIHQPDVQTITSKETSNALVRLRTVLITGTTFILAIKIQYLGRNSLPGDLCNDLGLTLDFNGKRLPALETEDFRIEMTAVYNSIKNSAPTKSVSSLPNDTIVRLVRDFDWEVFRDNLLFTKASGHRGQPVR